MSVQIRSGTWTSHPYAVLDAWWGEHFDLPIAIRLPLPLDQALSLHDFCSNFRLAPLKIPTASDYHLQPVLSPWSTEAEDLIFAAAGARQFIDILTAKSHAAYAYFRYAGAFVLDSTGKVARPIGDYKLWTRSNTNAMFEKKTREINTLALYGDRVNLGIESLLPEPPAWEKETAQEAWLGDVNSRLRILACLRPLYDTGALEIGKVGPDEKEGFPKTTPNELLIAEDEYELVLENIDLILEGNAPPEEVLRAFMAHSLVIPQVEKVLEGAMVDGGQLFFDSPVTQRIAGRKFAEVTNRPVDAFLKQWLSVSLPIPGGNLGEMLWAAQALRREEKLFSDWRTAVTESLQYASSLTGSDSHQDFTRFFSQRLEPVVGKLRTDLSRTEVFRKGISESFVTLGLGSAGVLGVGMAGGNVVDAVATGLATTLGTAALGFVRSRRASANPNPALDVFLSLGLKHGNGT
jgi:hypothetical protein